MAKQSPPQLLADEKHTWWLGEKVYVATTVADGCLLGAELSQTAGTEDLEVAYGVFTRRGNSILIMNPKPSTPMAGKHPKRMEKTIFGHYPHSLLFAHHTIH
jgi:hypothetical protein